MSFPGVGPSVGMRSIKLLFTTLGEPEHNPKAESPHDISDKLYIPSPTIISEVFK